MSFGDVIKASGFAGKLMFDVMVWMGDGNVHRVSRYKSYDRKAINAQVACIQAAGGKGVRITWQGPSNLFIHECALAWCAACEENGLLFSLLINPQVNGQANWWLDPGFLYMMSSPAYVPEKFISDFTTGIDYSKVTLPTGTVVLMNQRDFAWFNAYSKPDAGYATCNAETLAQLQTINKLATMRWPITCLQYFDGGLPQPAGVLPANFTGQRNYGQWIWGANGPAPRAIDHEAGNFFLDTVAALSLCPNAPYVSIVLNDGDETSGVEQFIASWLGIRIGQ